jgi:RNA polymerase sigma-70 factor (ECF subfamily)
MSAEKADSTSLSQEASAFPNATAWSLVLGAADRHSDGWKAHLDSLVRRYWKPVCSYLVRRWSCSPDDAKDLTQEFFAKLYEEDFLGQAQPERGRFRTFLKLKLRDLVLKDLRSRATQKRGGRARFVSIDANADKVPIEPAWPGLSPDEAFDQDWAAHFLSEALDELKAKLSAEGREAVFSAFWDCAVTSPPKSYRDCALQLGIKVNDVGNYVFRARQEFRRILIANVRESVEKGEDAEAELNYILGLFEGA